MTDKLMSERRGRHEVESDFSSTGDEEGGRVPSSRD
jgi:hypothetical protein